MNEERKSATPAAEPNAPEPSANGELPAVRDEAWERYLEVKQKIFALHDGLFRKLAEHDRQR